MAPTNLELEELVGEAALISLAAEWAALWERCPSATPFQSPEWLLAWRRHLGGGALLAFAMRDGGRLVGLAPFRIASYLGIPLRRVSPFGAGVSDYLDVLAEPGFERECARAVLGALGERRRRWDFVDLEQLRSEATLLRGEAPEGLRWQTRQQEVCPILDLTVTRGDWPAAVPNRLATNVRYYHKRLERELGAEIVTADGETLDPMLDALFRLHGARWRGRGLPGVFSSARIQAFHREAARGFLERGWLRLYGIRIEGEIRAVLYCFQAQGRAYYYGGGFDPALARLSPGTVLTGHAILAAVREGCREFDFLRGDEPYKYRWGAVDRPSLRRVLWKPSAPSCWAPALVRMEQRVVEDRRIKAFRHSGFDVFKRRS